MKIQLTRKGGGGLAEEPPGRSGTGSSLDLGDSRAASTPAGPKSRRREAEVSRPLARAVAGQAATGTGWPQWEQRFAASGMSLRHSGQGLVGGAGGGAVVSFILLIRVLIGSTTAK
jgi:hypothetical protein